MKTKILAVLAAASASAAVLFSSFPKARFTVHVIGEDGRPIPAANVSFAFGPQSSGGNGVVEGLTDGNGNFTAEGETAGIYGGTVTKPGYYLGGTNTPKLYHFEDRKWQPWDTSSTSILRRIENPIPMYVRITDLVIPVVDQSCGYDLEMGDWVSPWGKGQRGDLIVTLKRNHQDNNHYDVTVTLSFPKPGDGIQETALPREYSASTFKWPRLAPATGYDPSLTLHVWADERGSHGYRGDSIAEKKYFFRVRTVIEDGKVKSALYGKINDALALAPNIPGTCGLHVFYYLNPIPNDRNMEFDPTKNLSQNLQIVDQRLKNP